MNEADAEVCYTRGQALSDALAPLIGELEQSAATAEALIMENRKLIPQLREDAERKKEASAALAREKGKGGVPGIRSFTDYADAQAFSAISAEANRARETLAEHEHAADTAAGLLSRVASVRTQLSELADGLLSPNVASILPHDLGLRGRISSESVGTRVIEEWASSLVGHGRRLDEEFDSALSDFVAVDDGLINPPRSPFGWEGLQQTAASRLEAHVARRSSVRAFEQDVEHYLHLKADLRSAGDIQPVTQTLNELQKTFDRAYDLGRTKMNALSSGRSGANALYISVVALIIAVMSLSVEACSMTAARKATPESSGGVIQSAPGPRGQAGPSPTALPPASPPGDPTLTDSVGTRAPQALDSAATALTHRGGER